MWVVLDIGILSFPNRIMELNDDYFSGDKYGDFFYKMVTFSSEELVPLLSLFWFDISLRSCQWILKSLNHIQ